MERGFAAIALHNPKNALNVGSTLRAAGCYGADIVIVGGKRRDSYRNVSTDTQKAWRHIPTVLVDDVFDAMPLGSIPVAVELLPDAIDLPRFIHPERAFYIFGPEDGTLGATIHGRCKWTVSIPTAYCMNLAATVNVVLYDRLVKRAVARQEKAA